MKKIYTRLMIVVVVVMLLLTTFTACGNGDSQVSNSDIDELPVPVFSVENGFIEMEAPSEETFYQIKVNGEELYPDAANAYSDLRYIPLAEGDAVSIRSMSPLGDVKSRWSEEQICGAYNECITPDVAPDVSTDVYQEDEDFPGVLETPQVSVDQNGIITILPVENAVDYFMVDEETGMVSVVESGAMIPPSTPIRIYAAGYLNDQWVESELSDLIEFSCEHITFSTTENSFENAIDNGDGTYTLHAVSSEGKTYRFLIEGNLEAVENGWGGITENTRVISLDATHGILDYEFVLMPGRDVVDMITSIGYELDGNDTVNSYDEVDVWQQIWGPADMDYYTNGSYPSFFAIDKQMVYSGEPIQIEEWTLYFDGVESEYDHCMVHNFFYDALFLPGAPYDECAATAPLYLYFRHGDRVLQPIDYNGESTVINLFDSEGNVIQNTENYYLSAGDKVELSLDGKLTTMLDITREPLMNATTSNEAHPNSFSKLTGDMNVLVVPIYWADQADRANEQNMEMIYRSLGNIIDANGIVTTYSTEDPSEPSLSEYYKMASLNQLSVNSFVTDWYAFPANYSDVRDSDWAYEFEDVLQWVRDTYPNLDLSMFDNDDDCIFDEIIFINTGDMSGYSGYTNQSFAGAYRIAFCYGEEETIPYLGHGSMAISENNPALYNYININLGFLFENSRIGSVDELETGTLIHEFGHTLGLYDYYDTNGYNISALGGYDMQDANVGDWNVYSKYTAGWITPTVVDESSFVGSDTVTFTIRSSALTGDALLIPAAGYDYNKTPFDEYLILDLFTPEGLHTYDSARFGLENSVGVRIYHVSDLLEERSLEAGTDYGCDYMEFGVRVHTNYSGSLFSDEYGFHQIEIMSSTGQNKFTGSFAGDRTFNAKDLFTEGDTFTVEDFSEFFYNGKMDNGMEFGYKITVESISETNGEYTATIAVTRLAQ